MADMLPCVACGIRIPEQAGYVRTDDGPIHLRCPIPQTLMTRCPTCGRDVAELGYLVMDGELWHPGCPGSAPDRPAAGKVGPP